MDIPTFPVLLFSMLPLAGAAELDGYGGVVYHWVIVVIVLLIIGLLAVLIIEAIIVFRIARLGGVPFRSVWLGQILLFGIFLSYITLLAFIFKPTETSCIIIRLAVGVCYALLLSVLFVKLLIILSPKTQAGFLKIGHQVFILLLLWIIQIIINCEWVIVSPAGITKQIRTDKTDDGKSWKENEIALCKPVRFSTIFFDFLASFIYIMLLCMVVLVTSLVAYFRSQKRDGKANSEAKWILITTVLTTIIWLIWILVGSFIADASIASIAIGLWVTATTVLLVMFIPKLHKLATLKHGDEDEYKKREIYYEDEVPGMVVIDDGEAMELDQGSEHHSTVIVPSYQNETVLHSPKETITSLNSPRSIPERPPSVILEEKSNSSSIGPSPSVILKRGLAEKVSYKSDPYALELQHPTIRSTYQNHVRLVPENGVPPGARLYTIADHGSHKAASVIGAPRYDRHYISAESINPRHNPYYIHKLASPPSRQVVEVYEDAPRRYVYANPSYVEEATPSVVYKKVYRPSSLVGSPSYEQRVSYPLNRELSNQTLSRKASSQLDIRDDNHYILPYQNGIEMTGSLPKPAKILYKQAPNGRLIPVEQKQRAFNDDSLERRSVY